MYFNDVLKFCDGFTLKTLGKIAKVTGAVVFGWVTSHSEPDRQLSLPFKVTLCISCCSCSLCRGCLFITYELDALDKAVTIDTRAILQEKYKCYVYLKTTPTDEKENLTAGTDIFTNEKLKKCWKKRRSAQMSQSMRFLLPALPTVFPVCILGVSLLTGFTGSLISSRDILKEEPWLFVFVFFPLWYRGFFLFVCLLYCQWKEFSINQSTMNYPSPKLSSSAFRYCCDGFESKRWYFSLSVSSRAHQQSPEGITQGSEAVLGSFVSAFPAVVRWWEIARVLMAKT